MGSAGSYYVPDMLVDHVIPPERLERSWFRSRVRAQAASDVLSGLASVTVEQARAELCARLAAFPELATTPEAGTNDPHEFRDQLRVAYLTELLALQGEPRLAVRAWRAARKPGV